MVNYRSQELRILGLAKSIYYLKILDSISYAILAFLDGPAENFQ